MTASIAVAEVAPPRREYRCASCGYGISVAAEPQRCPMCGAGSSRHPSAVRDNRTTSIARP
jgi:rubrerythrin